MKKIAFVILLLFSHAVLAVDENQIRAGHAELVRACSQPGTDRYGSRASKECIAAGRAFDENAKQLMDSINQSMVQRDQERRRVQQEEVWREQVRRGYR